MRILHTMLRVRDLNKSIQFYENVLGMKLLRKKDFPEGKFTLAFLGYDDESKSAVLELTHNWETKDYNMGNAYGHIAVEVDDLYKMCDHVKEKGGKVVREPGPMKHGTTHLAFVKDPDGYMVELLGK